MLDEEINDLNATTRRGFYEIVDGYAYRNVPSLLGGTTKLKVCTENEFNKVMKNFEEIKSEMINQTLNNHMNTIDSNNDNVRLLLKPNNETETEKMERLTIEEKHQRVEEENNRKNLMNDNEKDEDADGSDVKEEEDVNSNADEDEEIDILCCDVCEKDFSVSVWDANQVKVASFEGPHSYQPHGGTNYWTACIDCIDKYDITCEYGSTTDFENSDFCEVCDLHFPRDNVVWFDKPFNHEGTQLYSACEKCQETLSITCEDGNETKFNNSSFCEVCELYFPRDNVVWFNKPFKRKERTFYSACVKCREKHNIYKR